MADKKKNTESAAAEAAQDAENVDRQPEGQTAAGTAEAGGTTDEFADPDSEVRVTAAPTRVRKASSKDEEDNGATPKVFTQLAKALGLKSSDILSYNEKTRVAVFGNGAKYQVSKNGKSVKHLAGPQPPADIKLDVVDARTRGYAGAAAAINAPAVVEEESPDALRNRRAELQAELEALDEQLADADEE